MKKNLIYNDNFYKDRNKKTKYSASKIEDILLEYFKIETAIDLGGGIGTWLNELKNKGIKRVKCIDGDYVNKKYLVIDEQEFVAVDLSNRVQLNERYDLAISLEVAEHLPSLRAKSFIEDLCNLSDIVLFSAATKKQGGDAHINEQRISYWINIFAKYNYIPLDIVRPRIWNDKRIQVWYRENILIFVNKTELDRKLRKEICKENIYDIIHPDLYEYKVSQYEELINMLPIKLYLNYRQLIKKIVNKKTSD